MTTRGSLFSCRQGVRFRPPLTSRSLSAATIGQTGPPRKARLLAPHQRGRRQTARAIRAGQAVLVIHGLDYNQNGGDDFAGAGASELNSAVLAEATDPAACGVLHRH